MTQRSTLLRGALVLLGDALDFDGQPRDVLVEGHHITAIAPAGTLHADTVIELPRRLLAPGLVNAPDTFEARLP